MAKPNKNSLLDRVAYATGQLTGAAAAVVEKNGDRGRIEPPEEHADVRYEHSDLNIKATFLTGIGVLVGMWLITGGLYFYFAALKEHRARVSPPVIPYEAQGTRLPPEPRLQASPRMELKQFRQKEDWELSHYHWLDKSHGIVALPITEAVRITAERGISPTHVAPNPTSTPPAQGTRETGFEGKVAPEPR